MKDLKNKDEYKEKEKERAEKLTKELEDMDEKDMQKIHWIMQGIKIAKLWKEGERRYWWI